MYYFVVLKIKAEGQEIFNNNKIAIKGNKNTFTIMLMEGKNKNEIRIKVKDLIKNGEEENKNLELVKIEKIKNFETLENEEIQRKQKELIKGITNTNPEIEMDYNRSKRKFNNRSRY